MISYLVLIAFPTLFSTFRPWMANVISRAVNKEKYDLDKELAKMQSKAEQWLKEQKAK